MNCFQCGYASTFLTNGLCPECDDQLQRSGWVEPDYPFDPINDSYNDSQD